MINFFDHFVILKNDIKTYDSIQKIAVVQGDDYTTGSILDHNYFNKYYKMIAIELSKQQARNPDPKEIQQISFMGNLRGNGNRLMFFIIEEAKETIFTRNCQIIVILFCFNIILI